MHRMASCIHLRITRPHVYSIRNARSKAAPEGPFTITIVTPENRDATTIVYNTLQDFHGEFREWRFQDTKTGHAFHGSSLDHLHVKPDVVYEATHEFHTARQEGRLHHQIADKAFEEKVIKAMERHLDVPGQIARFEAKDSSRPDGWRYLMGDKDIVEWDGLWQGVDGRIYCLEVKHFMDGNKLLQIYEKVKKTLKFLNKSHEVVNVYIAGEYWLTSPGIISVAQKLGFGIVEESGADLEVRDPELHHHNNREEVTKAVKRGRKPKAK